MFFLFIDQSQGVSAVEEYVYVIGQGCTNPGPLNLCRCALYRVIQEESAILWEMVVRVILSKKVYMNMCPILDDYGVMGIF